MIDRMPDSRLMVEFARGRSSEAFAAIVQRYVNLVYATARRMVGDEHDAQDVTQAAFIVLIKKAQIDRTFQAARVAGQHHPACCPGSHSIKTLPAAA